MHITSTYKLNFVVFESLHLIVVLSVNSSVLSIKFSLKKKKSRTQGIVGYASTQSLLVMQTGNRLKTSFKVAFWECFHFRWIGTALQVNNIKDLKMRTSQHADSELGHGLGFKEPGSTQTGLLWCWSTLRTMSTMSVSSATFDSFLNPCRWFHRDNACALCKWAS